MLPGTPLRIGWTAAAPTRLAVFAVDEGILQVARWKTPDPLSHFFRKRALEVTTAQILDLLLPEYEIVRSLAAPGGDQDGAPRRQPESVQAQGPAAGRVLVGHPRRAGGRRLGRLRRARHFNGTLRVVAVAVDAAAIGVAETRALVRGPFVVQPTIPYFAAPGDEFEVTALVTNTLDGSGRRRRSRSRSRRRPASRSSATARSRSSSPEGRDAVARWRAPRDRAIRASARCTFRATSGPHARARDARDEHPAGVAVPHHGRDALRARGGGATELPSTARSSRAARRDARRRRRARSGSSPASRATSTSIRTAAPSRW